MYMSLLLVVVYISTFEATKVNIEVILHQKDAFSLFDADELCAFEFVNKSANLAKLNVVIEESKYQSLLSSNKASTITDIKMIHQNVEERMKERLMN